MRVSLVFSALFLIGLHGASFIKILIILSINYMIAKVFRGSRWGPTLTWVFNGLVLFANERYAGYRFGDVLPALGFLVSSDSYWIWVLWALFVQDSYRGFYPRWHISFNITMLRLVSFNMDYYWSYCTQSEPKVSMFSSKHWELHVNTNDKTGP